MDNHASNPVNLGRKLADYLRDLRRRREVTQYEICQATGISHTTYRRYERNENDSNSGISLDALCALATYDGYTIKEFLEKLDDTPRSQLPAESTEMAELFREVPPAELHDFLSAIAAFEPDKAIPNPNLWLVRLTTVLLRSDRRFQLRVERDVLDQGINSDAFSQEQIDAMIRRLELIIREQFKRR